MTAMHCIPTAAESALIDELRDQLGHPAVLAGDAIAQRNCNDYSGMAPTRPLVVLRPQDTQAVALAMQICHRHGIAVVPQGGLTGLCGGARVPPGQVALSLERLVGIEEIDPVSATMTVAAGTPLETVQQAAASAGLFCPLDLGARGSCAIGGNLSTNAGGNRVIRYGMAREMVLGLEVVLADGTVITSLNKMVKNNAGFDLKQLFIGSEGTLGIITRVVLKLFPKPGSSMTAICTLQDYPRVLQLLASARRELGPLLSAFEVMWPDYWRFATTEVPGLRSPFAAPAGGSAIHVLVEALGTDASIDAPRFEEWLAGLLEQGVVQDAAVAQSVADERAFWRVRDATGEFHTLWPQHIAYDIGLPVVRMNDYMLRCQAELSARVPGCRSAFYGHIGDGNMHLVAFLAGAPKQPKDLFDEVVYGLVREFGGTVSAEHGIGTLKRRWLGHTRSQAEIGLMQTLKQALDPKNLLNPGKVI